jgi:glycosyltransferase involved in cell wall biosynthesis
MLYLTQSLKAFFQMIDKSNQFVIIFGPEIWSLQENGGISRYCYEIIRILDSMELNVKAIVGPNSNVYSKLIDKKLIVKIDRESPSSVRHAMSDVTRGFEKGIYHATYYDKQNLRIAKEFGLRTFVTVHDLIGDLFPAKIKWYQRRNRIQQKAVEECDHVVSVSKNTKKDLLRLYNVSEENVRVIHQGVSPLENSYQNVDLPKTPFVLHVGSREGYKNFLFTAEAISQSSDLYHLKVVAFGGGEFSKFERQRLEEIGMTERVQHLSGSDGILNLLYRSATALIYPSLYEGFGVPPLEAMRSRCPAVVSDRGSIPEICGSFACYFNPESFTSFEAAINSVLHNKYNYQLEEAFLHSQKYTWERTAERTLSYYREVI